MASYSTFLHIDFLGPEYCLRALKKAIRQKKRELEKGDNYNPALWSWIDAFDGYSIQAMQSPLTEAATLKEFIMKQKKEMPDLIVYGVILLRSVANAAEEINIRIVSKRGSTTVAWTENTNQSISKV